jgi:hypothetical protein
MKPLHLHDIKVIAGNDVFNQPVISHTYVNNFVVGVGDIFDDNTL